MLKINTQSEWIDRAKAALPAGGFGNFDPGIMISRGEGSRVTRFDGAKRQAGGVKREVLARVPSLSGQHHFGRWHLLVERLGKGCPVRQQSESERCHHRLRSVVVLEEPGFKITGVRV